MLARSRPTLIAAALVAALSGCGDEKPVEYVSPTGFRPVLFRTEGRITYLLLDAISEDGPFVRFVTKQVVEPGGPAGASVNYTSRRGDCDKFRYQTLGLGDTVTKMEKDRPDDRWVNIVEGSSATAGLVTACQALKKLK